MQDQAVMESVSELVALAGDGINEALANLPAEASNEDLNVAIETCQASIETVAMAAELAQMAGLQQLCGVVSETLGSLNSHVRAFQNYLGPRLCNWSSAVQLYLRQPNANGITEPLLAVVPSNQRDALRLKLVGTRPELITTESEVVTVTEEPDASAESVSAVVIEEEANIHGKVYDNREPFQAVHEETHEDDVESAADTELSVIFAESKQWHSVLLSATPTQDELKTACVNYNQGVERIQAAAMALGLDGFALACQFLAQNVQALIDVDTTIRLENAAQLAGWPDIARVYLESPDNESSQLAVIEFLMRSSWPQPLAEEYAEDLLTSLIPDDGEYLADQEERPSRAGPEDVALQIDPDVNPKLIEVFLQEAPVNATHFSTSLERVMRGEEIAGNLANAQRLAHNLKGSANLIGVNGLANLTHHIEDILEYLVLRQQKPTKALSNTLQEAADCIETMLEAVQGKVEAPADAQRILQDVLDWAHRADSGELDDLPETAVDNDILTARPENPEVFEDIPTVVNDSSATTTNLEASVTTVGSESVESGTLSEPEPIMATAVSPGKVIRVPVETIDSVFRLVGEVSIALDQLQERFDTFRRFSKESGQQDNVVQQRRFELENFIDVRHVASTQQRLRQLSKGQDFDPLEMDQYDELYSTTRSFIESVVDSRRMTQTMRSEFSTLERALVPLRRMKNDLQLAVMKTRMEPVDSMSARLQRSVRQAARATAKQVELIIEGSEIQLDSEVLDRLAEPLMHMLRNSVDHGIETPEERINKGKPEVGTIHLQFFQEGQNVVIRCVDDGRGLDYSQIRTSAIEKGLLHSEANAGNEELARLIMAPGFSTRSSATQLSGRGVGMDVVQTTIRDLQGVIEIGDADAGGCRISLRLPITLLTNHSLVVRSDNKRYAIPTSSIMRVISPGQGRFGRLGKQLTYEIAQESYPAITLQACLGYANNTEIPADTSSVVMVYSDTGPVAVAVDQLVNSYHMIVKSLGRYVGSVHGIAGLSSLADGGLIPVLDIAELLRTPVQTSTIGTAATNITVPAQPLAAAKIMIVDDSISVRQTLADLITDAGYQVVVAHDGIEAVELLRKQPPDLVLSDIEMPRMNGLELVSYIRTSLNATLPIIMITSRTMQKHRQQAAQAGANDYITKPFDEDALLERIRALLQ